MTEQAAAGAESQVDVQTQSCTFAELAEGAAFIFLQLGVGWCEDRRRGWIPQVRIKENGGSRALGNGTWNCCPDHQARVVEVRVFSFLKVRPDWDDERGCHIFKSPWRVEV